MNVWTSLNGAASRRTPMETVLRPTSFPLFVTRPNELPTARAQRWRTEYKEVAERQHKHVFAVVTWAFADARSRTELDRALQERADAFIAQQELSTFQFRVVDDPLEATVSYRLLGSSKIHTLTVCLRSPAQQEY